MFGKKRYSKKVNTKMADCQNLGSVQNLTVGIILNLQES